MNDPAGLLFFRITGSATNEVCNGVRGYQKHSAADISSMKSSFVRTLFVSSLVALTTAVARPIPAPGGESGAEPKPVSVLQYAGVLAQPGGDEAPILRKFEALRLTSSAGDFFNVLDDVRSGCQWPESYGLLDDSLQNGLPGPHLLYEFEGSLYPVSLPPLVISLPENVVPEQSFDQGALKLTVLNPVSEGQQKCWLIEARERRGRRQMLTVNAESGVLVNADVEVIVGQGDQFRLTLRLTGEKQLDPDQSKNVMQLQADLMALQRALNRRPETHHAEFSARQLKTIETPIESLTSVAAGTPLQELVMRISQDLERQKQRLMASETRAESVLNSSAPEFSLNLIGGGSIDSQSLRGSIVVLHFWQYRDQPIAEPYGQTGYLDFVSAQRKKMKVQVIGVCTGQDFHSSDSLPRARRSAKKLVEFMNLTYPVAYDDGSLLRALGDPRENNGQLPLWIVLSPEGKVSHYHAGFYEIDPAKGLEELDKVLIEQIRSAQKTSR